MYKKWKSIVIKIKPTMQTFWTQDVTSGIWLLVAEC